MFGRIIFILAIIFMLCFIYYVLNSFGKKNIEKTALIFKAILYFLVAVGTASEIVFIPEKEVTILQTAIIVVSFTETIVNFVQFHNEYKAKKD